MEICHQGVLVLIALWTASTVAQSVFENRPQAHMLLRPKRANSFLEEIKPPSKERECVEEVCNFEEAREIFQSREALMEFWTVYTDGNQCEPNPCVNGTCLDQFQSYFCKCNPGFEGKLCDQYITATNCSIDNGNCDHVCRETADGRTCSCVSGYSLKSNSRTCEPTAEYACGRVHIPRATDNKVFKGLTPWLVGGEIGKKGESPWQALILNERGLLHCGGALIAESWVLTAAHCLENTNHVTVRLGDYNYRKKEDTEITLPVSEVFSHPDYNTETVDNDIALLHLSSPVRYTPFIAPVCLPSSSLAERILHRNGTSTMVTGWGKKNEQNSHYSYVLNYILIPLMEHSQCARAMLNNISHNVLCGGWHGRHQDACQGDSGGPMVTKYANTWFLIGLVSWGEGCGDPDKPGIYTKVSNYLDWIESIKKGNAKP